MNRTAFSRRAALRAVTATALFADARAQTPAPAAATAAKHPTLMTNRAGVELAKKRVAEEAWAKQLLEELIRTAGEVEKAKLPVFDNEWWKEAIKKSYRDVYPEVSLHTGSAVRSPMTALPGVAMAYALTGKPEYAALVRRVLLHYTTYQFVDIKHPDVGMNIAGWCGAGLKSYDFIFDTVNAADRRILDDFFERALKAILINDKDWLTAGYSGPFNNHNSHRKRYIGCYGLFYGKPEYVEYAIDAEEGFRDLVENASRDDGLWHESSIHYHFTGTGPIAGFAGELASAGHALDLWNVPFANGRRVRDFFTAPVQTLFPDGTIPTIGDTYGRRSKLRNTAYFDAFNAYPDPIVGWVLRDAAKPATALFLENLPQSTFPAPPMKTRMWPEHGYIFLRTQEGVDYWKGDGFSAFLSVDRNGIHSHADKLGLMVFGRGVHVAADVEASASVPHAFSSQIQRELNRHTVCHNTVMVHGKNHNGSREKLSVLDYIDGDGIKIATVADLTGIACRGVKMMRTVAATPDYLLDIFQVASAEEHTYDYMFHTFDDKGALGIQGSFEPFDFGQEPPWNWLRNGRARTVDAEWQATARQGSVTTRLLMAGQPRTRLIACDFPSKDDFTPPSIPMLMARRTARSTVFVALMHAERGGLPDTELSVRNARFGLLRVAVKERGAVREFTAKLLA